jgi:hypothetical protein
MSRIPRAASPWGLLQRDLGGSFVARAHGLLGTKFALLDSRGRRFGWLRLRGLSVAELRAGDYTATLKKTGERYRMFAYGEELLVAEASKASIDELEISCGGHTYEARASFFRNLAVASHPGGERIVRLSGGLTGRSYEALFAAGDGYALPVAVFLLWHVVANRRRAYRMGYAIGGGAM